MGLFFLKRKLEIQFTKRCLINILKVKVLKSLDIEMPVDTRAIAQHVADTMPYIQQVFVDITKKLKTIVLARKQIENIVKHNP